MKNLALFFLTGAAALLFLSCEKSNEPEIVGCNSVKYKGYTYTNLGCTSNMLSMDVTVTQNGHTASFYITCSDGCISSVTAKE